MIIKTGTTHYGSSRQSLGESFHSSSDCHSSSRTFTCVLLGVVSSVLIVGAEDL